MKEKKMSAMGIAAGAGALISGAKALGIGAGAADKRQLKQQEKLQDLSIKGSKEMTDYTKAAELEMWKNTNWAAQREEAEKAGLSVGWLMGKGGGQGGTTGSGGMSVGMGQAADAASRENAKTQQMMAAAQIANLNADTEKKKVEAGKIEGVDTELGKTQIASLTQGIENAKAQEALTRVQTAIGGLDAKLKELSMDDALDLIAHTARKADAEANIAFNEAYVSGETRETKVQIMRAELVGTTLRNILTKAQTQATNAQTAATRKSIEVSDAQIKQMSENIAQGWAGLGQGESKIAIDKFKEEVKANYPSIMNTAGRLLDSTIDGIFSIGGRVRRVYNKVN